MAPCVGTSMYDDNNDNNNNNNNNNNIGKLLSYLTKNFSYRYHVNADEWHEL